MWKISARIRSFHNISGRRNALYCGQTCLCSGKLYVPPGQTSAVRSFSNGRVQGSSGVGKVVLGTTLLATGAVVGGVYYASIDPNFRQNVQNKIPYSSTLLNAILGKTKSKQIDMSKKAPDEVLHSSSKKSSAENNLLPISDQTPPIEPSEEKLLNSEVSNIQAQDMKIEPHAAAHDNTPATISSVDQIGVSAVDLDISKAVEKGIADSKKGSPSSPVKDAEVCKGGSEVSKDTDTKSKCSECMGEKEKEPDVVKEETTDVAKKASSEVQKDAPPLDILPEATAEINPFDVALSTAMAKTSDLGQKAIELHEQAVTAVQHHRDSVKEALERFEKDGASKEDWELLSKLSESKNRALDEAEQVGAELSDLVENVQRSITEAKEKGQDGSAEIASETLAKLTYALQQVKNRLKESQDEGSALKQFQEFIKEGKEHLAKELAAIRPEFEIDMSNDKADAALLAYAQKRMRLLEDTLHKREQHERKLLEEALKKQQSEHEKLSAMKLNHELEKLRNDLNAIMLQKEAEETERHENDLRTQLRRQAAAFSDHLSDVLKVQETELNTKHDGELREKLLLSKQESELKLRGALARLNGIISAIRSKADTEKHNVEAQELWLACHSLSTAITGLGDERSRPYPIHSEVDTIRRVTNGNEVVGKVIDSLSDDVLHRGVYTEESLRRRFPSVKRVCKQVAMVGEEGGGVWSYFISYLQSLFVFETHVVTPPVSVDPEELDTYKILSLATYALENGDTEQAVRYMNQLRGEPRRIAKDWIREARLFVEAKQVARFLTSYASAYNIGVEQHK